VNPGRLLPETAPHLEPAVDIDLNQPMADILKKLSQYPIKTRLKLNGTLIVARDIAHAKIKELLDAGKPMPEYFKTTLCIMQVQLKHQKECRQVVLDQQPLVVWMCM
jgi:tartrate dehydratase beta subunit/fumarate hydratase class I family protein